MLVLCRSDGGRPAGLGDDVRWQRWDAPLAAKDLPMMFRTAAQLRHLLGDFDPDIVHVHGLRSFAATRAVRRRTFVPNHTFDTLSRPRSLRGLAYRTLPLLASSAYAVAPGLGSRWTVLAHASPRLHELTETTVSAAGPLSVLWLGRLTPQKRPEDFVRAVALAARSADVVGVVVGDGPLVQACTSLAAELGAPVTFTGPQADVQALFAAADVFCLLSNFEGVPFAVQEAMWCALPVVLSPLPALQCFAGEAAVYARDVDEAAEAFVLLSDERERRRSARLSRARATEMVTPQSPGPAYAAAYEQALRARPRRPEPIPSTVQRPGRGERPPPRSS